MTQLINPRLESLNSLQKMQREYSAEANDFKTAKDASANGSNIFRNAFKAGARK